MHDATGQKNNNPAMAWLDEVIESLIFLTRLPVRRRNAAAPGLVDSMRVFPVAGVIIGALAGAVCTLALIMSVPPLVAAGLGIAASVAITGALHEDAISDVADGFGGGKTKDRKLEIMHDSRCGAFGITALVLVLVIKVASLGAISTALSSSWLIIPLFAAISGWPRALAVSLIATTPNARGDGLAESVGIPGAKTHHQALLIGLAASTLLIGAFASWTAAFVAIALSFGAFWLVKRLALSQIGGHTGDVAGTVVCVGETVMLITLSAMV